VTLLESGLGGPLGEELLRSSVAKGLVVTRFPTSGIILLYVDLEGRAETRWQQRLFAGAGTWGIPFPDGGHLALVGYTTDSNVWMLENF